MRIQDNYRWEAEKPDGSVVTRGEDLSDCVRFSMRAANGLALPAHDLIGIPMVRRFARGFKKVRINDQDHVPEKLVWENGSNIVRTGSDLRLFFYAGDRIRPRGPIELCPWYGVLSVGSDRLVIDRPFDGKSGPCVAWRTRASLPMEYVHTVVCKGFRYHVRSSDGTALVTPEDYELYL